MFNYFIKSNRKDIKKTIQELEENLKYFIKKIQAYYQKLHQVILKKKLKLKKLNKGNKQGLKALIDPTFTI